MRGCVEMTQLHARERSWPAIGWIFNKSKRRTERNTSSGRDLYLGKCLKKRKKSAL